MATPPAGPARSSTSPALLVAGLVVIVAIVAGAVFVINNNSKSSKSSPSGAVHSGAVLPTGSTSATHTPGTGTGSITITPKTFDCSDSSTEVVMSVSLPGTVSETEQVSFEQDGTVIATNTVGGGFEKQSDGSWLEEVQVTASDECAAVGPGAHNFRVLDSQGQVLAEGGYTITGTSASGSAEPTALPSSAGGGEITFDPSTVSCAATSTEITISMYLPSSVSSSEQITAYLDDAKGQTSTVGDGFDTAEDGRWVSIGTATAGDMCASVAQGDHTMRVVDSQNTLLAQGSFTLTP